MPLPRMEAPAANAQHDALRQQWTEYLRAEHRRAVQDLALQYPDRKSLEIAWDALSAYGTARRVAAEAPGVEGPAEEPLAEVVLRDPRRVLAAAQHALRDWVAPPGGMGSFPMRCEPEEFQPFVRIVGLPETSRVSIRGIRSVHMGRLIEVEALVKRVGDVLPRVVDAFWRCRQCGSTVKTKHDKEWVDDLDIPTSCFADQSGCGVKKNVSPLEFQEELATYRDAQFLQLQEPPEQTTGSAKPVSLDAMLEDDLVAELQPGDRVVITGYFAPTVVRKNNREQRQREKRFLILAFRKRSESYEEIVLDEEVDVPKFRAAAEARTEDGKPAIYGRLTASLAPSIHGHDVIKLALMCSLFSGTPKHLENEPAVRSDIHVLLAGDPGVAKSRLIKAVVMLAPRGVYTSGNQASAAGLTAAAVQDEFTGGWTLEAGALVLADTGVCGLDEIEKMDKAHQKNLTTVLEQQTVDVAKAGIIATLNARTTVVAAANPRDGKFKANIPLQDQIELPPPILSRFFVFLMKDTPDRVGDKTLALRILKSHRAINQPSDDEHLNAKPYYERDFLRRYIAFAKRHCHPILTDPAIEKLADFFSTIRNMATAGSEDQATTMTVRQLEDAERLTEAIAKMRLSNVADVADAELAIEVFREYVNAVARDSQGNVTFARLNTGVTSQQERESTLKRLARQLQKEGENTHGGFRFEDLVLAAEKEHIKRAQVDSHWRRWTRQGEVHEPRVGYGIYRLT